MNDVTVIDRFLDTFSRYIDSGFGLLHGEVAFLTATLIVIDMTLAGLFWAMSHATGQGEDVIAKLIRKVLYVGAFAYIIGNFNWLAGIVFRSFAGLGLTASGSTLSMENFLQPGRLAKVGIDAGAPILKQIGDMAGFPEVFVNITPIVVMFLAWLIVLLCFFVLAIQLFITLIEFKLTTLAGFVLVPFALWNKTAFLAEKVLGNVVSSGIKVLVLAVIVGIGSGLFAEFQVQPAEPSIDHSVVVMLASLTLLALGIFGPGIATGLVSGSPQLGAGAMAGAALGAAGVGNVAKTGAQAAGQKVADGARSMKERVAAAFRPDDAGSASGGGAAQAANEPTPSTAQPAWAKRLHRRQQLTHAATTAAHTLRGGDGGSSSQGPSLRDSDS
ncbi:P-type conjugative transfer protein TrbL [Burkholderia stabilis]